MSVREITIGNVPVRALRVTYVGELGWEIYCPTEYGLGLWRTLWEVEDLVAGGYRAIDSLRLEKGYRVWGADITPDETPYGVGFCVKLDKDAASSAARRWSRPPSGSAHAALLPGARRPALGGARERAGPHRREIVGRVTTEGSATRSSARSPTRTCRPSTPSTAPRWRSRSSAIGSPARSPASRSSIPRGSGSGTTRCPPSAPGCAAAPGGWSARERSDGVGRTASPRSAARTRPARSRAPGRPGRWSGRHPQRRGAVHREPELARQAGEADGLGPFSPRRE